MDGEHVPYIFGSFSRRRQCDDVKAPKRRSLDQLPGQSTSSSTSSVATTVIPPPQRRNPRMSEKQNQEFQCGLCQHQVCEPRVLPCLHTFCTACLQRLETEAGPRDMWDDETGSLRDGGAGSTGSGGSGYESGGGGSWTAVISCPRCGEEYRGNVTALPPNYVLQHRLVLASLNRDTTRILCDLCSTDVPASCRCTACLLSLCTFCAEAHSRQRVTAGHEVLPLHEAKQRGINCVRRQVMCPLHPELELTLFCNACSQVACRECCLLVHRGHSCETAPRAAQLYVRSLRDSLDRARPMADDAVVSLDRLRRLHQRIQARCTEVQVEVDQFIDAYIAALEEHRRSLQIQVQEQREAKLHAIRTQQQRLERLADETRTAVSFAEDLLTEGSDVELLSLVVPVLRRLEWCCSSAGGGSSCLLEPRVSDCLQFLPNENAGKVKDYPLYGVITTQTVSPPHCTLDIDALMDCRQHRKAETLMITRDADEQPLCHGGEKVVAELRYRDASRRQIPVQVSDRRDGTYLISFVPDTAGNLSLSVSVRGKPIQGSPFHVCVRTLRPHQGTFHCCTFCSSGGNKEASCGCGGTMPGGYKGCGHGHTGHPGRRHWSCCGNILQNSECGRTNSAVYQFTL